MALTFYVGITGARGIAGNPLVKGGSSCDTDARASTFQTIDPDFQTVYERPIPNRKWEHEFHALLRKTGQQKSIGRGREVYDLPLDYVIGLASGASSAEMADVLKQLWASPLRPGLTVQQAATYMAADIADLAEDDWDPSVVANALFESGLFLNHQECPLPSRLLLVDEPKFKAKFPELALAIPQFSVSHGLTVPGTLKPGASRPTLTRVK